MWSAASVAVTDVYDPDLYFDPDHYADPLGYVLALRAQGRLSPPHYAPIALLSPQLPVAALPME